MLISYNLTSRIGIAFVLIVCVFFYCTFATVSAVSTPTFSRCSLPQGDLVVSYDSGIHGIVGSSKTYNGTDEVYRLTDSTFMQCFCDRAGNGIQTNWWKTSSLTPDERKSLTLQGWEYIPDGSAWGLASGSYLAKNSAYLCKGGLGSGQVLGLASTGSIPKILLLFGIGIFSFIIGIYLRLRKDQ